ncbi:hypothetical protein HYFRA_00013944 [Hymenoscyphus fraxineus]|uniref:Uncharacterized protein n=1 Tax=Hymenoscyphus fraxineus TaxID=746836 RepID=A0A9N9LDK9_9HELO|nr:hypothetical protein HYFRA_00013944 [Hymenoscyphus fraxineus]
MTTALQTQLGILFGFLGAILLFVLGFSIAWRIRSKREAVREEERKKRICEMGFGKKGFGEDYAGDV